MVPSRGKLIIVSVKTHHKLLIQGLQKGQRKETIRQRRREGERNKQELSYGSHKPFVRLNVASGQYEPKGQAARLKSTNQGEK